KQNIDNTLAVGPRWQAVLSAVQAISNWQPKVANSVKQTGDVRKGRGLAFGTFANSQVAMVADIELSIKTGKIVAKHLYIAHASRRRCRPGLRSRTRSSTPRVSASARRR